MRIPGAPAQTRWAITTIISDVLQERQFQELCHRSTWCVVHQTPWSFVSPTQERVATLLEAASMDEPVISLQFVSESTGFQNMEGDFHVLGLFPT